MGADVSTISTISAFDPSCHLGSGCGFPAPTTEIFFLEPLAEFTVLGLDVTITKQIALLLGSALVVIAFSWYAFRRPQLVPRGAQNVGEYGYLFIRDGIARDIIGKKEGDKFVPLLFTAFFFIWLLNFLGILPFAQIPATSTFAIPVAFALIVYFTWVPLGIMRQGFVGFFKNIMFPPGLPTGLYFLLAPIEFLSNIIVRPFTHAIRLFANMFAGHLLITTFSVATFYLLSWSIIGLIGSAASFVVTIGLTGFEVLIQGLQAYIFTLLTAVYISGALEAEH